MKYKKRQILEAIRFWESRLHRMNESTSAGAEYSLPDELSKKAETVGQKLFKYVKSIAKSEEYKDEEPINIDVKEILATIPQNEKERFFSFISQDDMNSFVKEVKSNGITNFYNLCQRNNRKEIIDGLLTHIIYGIQQIEFFGPGENPRWNEYYSYSVFDDVDSDPKNAPTVDLVFRFCLAVADIGGTMLEDYYSGRKHKFEATIWWYVPEMRTITIDAIDEEEAEEKIDKMYKRYRNSHSEDQDIYNGVWRIKKI